ncbi:hypothetical protein [Williamsia muralis]|uniref:hypothetical protein n=1 Tax=Williamsia marianensis TaxID=85044 RepID=UPI00078964C6|nr:hypothetical protein [Williamsia muralis]
MCPLGPVGVEHEFSAVANYGEPLTGRILVDISNTFNADASGLATATGTSAAQEIAVVAHESAHVVKALNTIFGHVLAQDKPLDAFGAIDRVD